MSERTDLKGRVALVTGSSSGTAAAVAAGLADLGAAVVVNSAPSVAAGPNGSRTGSRGAPLGRSRPVPTHARAAEDGGTGHSQPTRLKYQRSTTTVTAMMAIVSG